MLTCEEEDRRLDDSISKQKAVKTAILALAAVITMAAAGFCFAGFWCDICKKYCLLALVITACIDSVLLPLVGTFSSKTNELKAQKQEMCADIRVSAIHDRASAMDGMWYTVGGSVAGVTCLVGSLGLGFGWFGITGTAAKAGAVAAGGSALLAQGGSTVATQIGQDTGSVISGAEGAGSLDPAGPDLVSAPV